MNSTINYLAEKFGLDTQKHPIEINNINRTIMAQTLKELGFKVGAEIGVAQGWHVVQAFVYASQIRPLFVLTNDTRDPKFAYDAPGWLFVRQETDLL